MRSQNIKISSREAQILNLMGNGFTSKEIGRKLFISNLTVDKHKRNMMHKFHARNSVQMVALAYQMGVIRNWA